VQYGNPLSFSGLIRLLAKLVLLNVLPNGRSLKLYGTTTSKFGRSRYLDDWATLFGLLEEGKIKPVIMAKFPILEAAEANELLESGQVVGNVVLVAPELL
jgi:NADPH:quinone reductase-like Zn-dependent oxidoreductase